MSDYGRMQDRCELAEVEVARLRLVAESAAAMKAAELPMPILRVELADGSDHEVPRGDDAVILWMREAMAREVILKARIAALEAPAEVLPEAPAAKPAKKRAPNA